MQCRYLNYALLWLCACWSAIFIIEPLVNSDWSELILKCTLIPVIFLGLSGLIRIECIQGYKGLFEGSQNYAFRSMKIRNGTFCTIFPGYKDFHFYKDPGQIPYRFSKLGYTSTLVCYGRGHDFPETEKYLKITCITDRYLSRKFNSGIIFYLLCQFPKN